MAGEKGVYCIDAVHAVPGTKVDGFMRQQLVDLLRHVWPNAQVCGLTLTTDVYLSERVRALVNSKRLQIYVTSRVAVTLV